MLIRNSPAALAEIIFRNMKKVLDRYAGLIILDFIECKAAQSKIKRCHL